MSVKVVKSSESAEGFVLQKIEPKPVVDNDHIYCLDHLSHWFADDTVNVFKTKITEDASKRVVSAKIEHKTAFLQLLASKAVDETAGIVRNFIRTAFILLSNNPDFQGARAGIGVPVSSPSFVVFDDQFDPFDHEVMGEINQSLTRFGFCLVLEDYTFDRTTSNRISVNDYCNAPHRQAIDHKAPAVNAIQNQKYHTVNNVKPTSGVFYRPKASYSLSIYIRQYPDPRLKWKLGSIQSFEMENIMPIVSVNVGRAAFATRRTGLVFEDGALKNVCISKGSEVAGFIEIPLDVVYGIIALPSEIVRATYVDVNTRKALVTAQNKLITAQNEYIKFLNNKSSSVTAETPDKITLGETDAGGAAINGNSLGQSPPVTAGGTPTEGTDAGAIFVSGNGRDALADICENLMAASKTAEDF